MPRERLQPGQDTIDSAHIKEDPRGGYRMKWSIRLPDGITLRRDTRGCVTKGELRAKARRQAEELKATCGLKSNWNSSDLFGGYIKSEALPSMEESPRLRPSTRERYALCLSIATESLGGYPIANAQQKAGEMTIKNVEEVTARSKKVIDLMVEESKKRIERLSMVTLPDRLFYYSKWMAVILVLIILVHVLWGMLV